MALILIIFGSVLVYASLVFFSELAAPRRFELTESTSTRTGSIPLEANKTTEVGIVFMNAGKLQLTWAATTPISLYVLNETQYDDIVLRRVDAIRPYFTEPPSVYLRKFFSSVGQDAITLRKGSYHILASTSNSTVLTELFLSYPSAPPSGEPQIPFSSEITALLPFVVAGAEGAIGVLVVVLGLLILTKRFWITRN